MHHDAILLTHGFGSAAAFWSSTVEALAGERNLIAWDLRGHGGGDASDDPDEYTVAASLDDMRRLLDDAGAERAVLVGHSLGGYLSLAFALTHPERLAGLVLVGTGPGYRSDAGRDEWNRRIDTLADEAATPGLALAARGILRQSDSQVIDGLPSIGVPVMVVIGERDRQFTAGSQYLAAKIPDATLVTIPGAGHEPPVTHPAEFAAAVRRFLVDV